MKKQKLIFILGFKFKLTHIFATNGNITSNGNFFPSNCARDLQYPNFERLLPTKMQKLKNKSNSLITKCLCDVIFRTIEYWRMPYG